MLLCSVDNITFGPGLLSVGGKSLPEVGGLRYLVFCDQPSGRLQAANIDVSGRC